MRILGASLAAVLLGAAAGACTPGDRADRTIEVAVRYSRFRPAHLEVRAGETVRFVVRNRDPIAHEFILGDRKVQGRHERGTEQEHGAVPGEISVPAGAEVATTYTFAGPGSLIFGCHLPGHFAYGMRGTVRIL